MTVPARIIISLEVFCLLLSGVLLYGLIIQRRQKTTRLFKGIVLCNVVGLLSDIAFWTLSGVPGIGVFVVLWIGDYLSHAIALVVMMGLVEFLWMYLEEKNAVRARDHRYILWIRWLSAVNAVMLAVAQSFGLFSYFDEYNWYHATDYYLLSMIFPVTMLCSMMWFIFRYRKSLDGREATSFYIAYILFPILCLLQQFIDPDLTVAYILVDVILLILYANVYSERAKKLREKEKQIALNKVMATLAQIQPDFLYDTLGAIEGLCLTDPVNAQQSVLDFTKHLRVRLDAIALKEKVPFEEELAHVRSYLSLEDLRLPDVVRVQYNIETTDFLLPALAVQMLVEDLIDIAAARREIRQNIFIASYETEKDYRVEIERRNLFISPTERDGRSASSFRLDTVRDELAALCGGEIEDRRKGRAGRTVTIIIPRNNAKELLSL